MDEIPIGPAGPADAGEILTLQLAAYVTEAQLYDDPHLPALTQTLDELTAELADGLALKATLGHRIVGAVRGRLDGTVLRIGRLTVAPDLRGRGLGTRLLTAIERAAAGQAEWYALFTGHLSETNIRLYERARYEETHREQVRPGLTLVHLMKENA
ncbi:GCN5 family acetyltransferase [Actinoplanes sp. SE50]|uniref:GNAT family N-acetyltransferase n=1 Tax=unclassified Actinoplanes TaxID=2626549 RepID=UPI00023ECB05|nr:MULTISPECIES: GNAT family N-acetyltransferase [unclassified Actinoplanes]AEV83757.1 GCN5-related N-acetyltransferase [Actinoplanes sp. SE50/110]ATO82099.1 GCN5 family acetyltransferase [Actinoplanes sp. SE50]SLL99506.1 GCN5 family acetyltransferase [Actinoplanes sp. SE50/110]